MCPLRSPNGTWFVSYLNLKAQLLPVCLQSVLFTCNDASNVSAFNSQRVEHEARYDLTSTFGLVSVVLKGFTVTSLHHFKCFV